MPNLEDQITSNAELLVRALSASGNVVATAESCTGGWVSKAITDISGSSAVFDCGFVTYSNASKMALLNVKPETLESWGAVSQQTVQEMAEGALNNSRATITVSISGIAGPSGGAEEKPVGTVWLAWAKQGKNTVTRIEHFTGDREQVRAQATLAALKGLLQIA